MSRSRCSARAEKRADALEQLGQVEPLAPHRQLALAAAGHDQHVLGQLGQVVALLDDSTSASRTCGSCLAGAQRALQLGLDHRHRRTQLVARVRDEAALALERAPQAVEHLVERLAEPADLVVGGGQRQPVVRVGERNLLGSPAHRLDRAQPRGRRARSRAATPARPRSARRSRTTPPGWRACRRGSWSDWPTATTWAPSPCASTRAVPSTPATRRSVSICSRPRRRSARAVSGHARARHRSCPARCRRAAAAGRSPPPLARAPAAADLLASTASARMCSPAVTLSSRSLCQTLVDEQAGHRQHRHHRERERDGQARPDRKAAHAAVLAHAGIRRRARSRSRRRRRGGRSSGAGST